MHARIERAAVDASRDAEVEESFDLPAGLSTCSGEVWVSLDYCS